MRILFTCLIASFLFLSSAQAQLTLAKKGDIDVAIGIGLLPTFAADDARLLIPPLSATVDYRIAPNFSVGTYFAFSSSEISQRDLPNNGDIYTWQNDFSVIGFRLAAHGVRIDNWDFYGGFMLGLNMPNVTQTIISDQLEEKDIEDGPDYYRPAKNTTTFSGFLGATYYVAQNFGIYGEIGFGISIFNLGLSYKI